MKLTEDTNVKFKLTKEGKDFILAHLENEISILDISKGSNELLGIYTEYMNNLCNHIKNDDEIVISFYEFIKLVPSMDLLVDNCVEVVED